MDAERILGNTAQRAVLVVDTARPHTRRELFQLAGGGAGGILLHGIFGGNGSEDGFDNLKGSLLALGLTEAEIADMIQTKSPPVNMTIIRRPAIIPEPQRIVGETLIPAGEIADLKALESEGLKFRKEIINRARVFMKLSPEWEPRENDLDRNRKLREYKERVAAETNTFSHLEENNASAGDILLALEASATIPARAWGMELLWQMRQKGDLVKYKIYPLDSERERWARGNGVDPRLLAIARESFYPSLALLNAAPDLYLEAVPQERRHFIPYTNRIPTPGIVAALQSTETGWIFPPGSNELRSFVNIGSGHAFNELNLRRGFYPSGRTDLQFLAAEWESFTGLPFKENVANIPGSKATSIDSSGGAIYPQFMPIFALLFSRWYKEANSRIGNVLPTPTFPNPWIS